MFQNLSSQLGGIFDRLRQRGVLSEKDIDSALQDIRNVLLEADVALPVVKDFIAQVKEQAAGQNVVRSVTPGQQVVKIVHDALVKMLGGDSKPSLNLNAAPPVSILMVGLQGSGKTTTTAKIALRLKTKERKKVLMASLDVNRPAAQDQLRILGEQIGVATLPIIPGQKPLDIAARALQTARLEGYDVLMLDTAGRLAIDTDLMAEVASIRDITRPQETLLVADALTGQDAVTIATEFQKAVGLTGLVLTRMDSDARGGATLSMRAVTGQPIKFIGVGEKMDALEDFHAERIAGRILDMGDVVSLVEKAAQVVDEEEAKRLAAKMEKGEFTLEDMAAQLRQMRKMGGLGGIMNLLPGVGALKKKMDDAKLDEKVLLRQEAIISSMTPKERRKPEIILASRKKRIAAGAGVTVNDVNKLLKQHEAMHTMMKQLKKSGMGGLMGGLSGLFGGGGLPPLPGGGGLGGPFRRNIN